MTVEIIGPVTDPHVVELEDMKIGANSYPFHIGGKQQQHRHCHSANFQITYLLKDIGLQF